MVFWVPKSSQISKSCTWSRSLLQFVDHPHRFMMIDPIHENLIIFNRQMNRVEYPQHPEHNLHFNVSSFSLLLKLVGAPGAYFRILGIPYITLSCRWIIYSITVSIFWDSSTKPGIYPEEVCVSRRWFRSRSSRWLGMRHHSSKDKALHETIIRNRQLA
jgi:hypothetical protein